MPVNILGQITLGDARLYFTDVDPTTLGGLDVPVGSVVSNSGGIFYKFGTGLTDFNKALVFADITSGVITTALGYTPENQANKATDFSTLNNTKYPSTLAVDSRFLNKQDYNNSFLLMGA